jgi:hypothetical protein
MEATIHLFVLPEKDKIPRFLEPGSWEGGYFLWEMGISEGLADVSAEEIGCGPVWQCDHL